MNILSIDLASKRYRDFGWAQLKLGSKKPIYLQARDLGLADPPVASTFAEHLHQYCEIEQVQALLLDGPQGWRYPTSSIQHMRLCERVLNTPCKTGTPGNVKPGTYLGYAQFSIDVFNRLYRLGWSLLTRSQLNRPAGRIVMECFPSFSWRTLGLTKLPAKSRIKVSELEPFRQSIEQICGYDLQDRLSHDELQATIILPVGEAILRGDPTAIAMAGIDPIIEGTTIYEGWIPLPRLA